MSPLYDDGKGYKLVNIRLKDDKILSRSVHRLVKLVFDYIPGCEDLDIDHKNCVKSNNYLYNLDWVTRKENIIRAHENNLCSIGEDYYKSIFTNEEVHMICKMLSDRTPIRDIANTMSELIYPRKYSDMMSTIYSILYKECWNSISKDYIFPSYNDYNFTDEQVKQICECLQNDICYDNILINLGYDINNMSSNDIIKLKGTLSHIKNRRYYTDISKDYIFNYDKNYKYSDKDIKYICICIKNSNMSNTEIFESMKLDVDTNNRKKYIGTINDIRRKKCFRQISNKYF